MAETPVPAWAGSRQTRTELAPAVARFAASPATHLMRPLMAVYLFLLILLPSGSLLGINVKILCFFLLLPLAVQVSFARRQITAPRLIVLLLIPAVFLLWTFASQLYGFDPLQSTAQYKDLMVTLATCWFGKVLCGDSQRDALFVLRWVVYAEVATSSLKLLLLTYALVRGIPVSELVELIRVIFGVQLMPFDFESMLGRIQFISDNLIPICLFALLGFRRLLGIRNLASLLMLLVMVVSSLFSFSRYLYVFVVLGLVCGLVFGQKDRFQAVLLGLLSGLTVLSLPVMIPILVLRFSTSVVTSSDADRIQQIAALRLFIADAPWFGHGLGSYTHLVIRSETAPYSYEAQLLALLGQIGIVGVALLFGLLLSYFRRLWPDREHSGSLRFGLLVLLVGWLAGGFFNPSLISSAASVSYVALYAMASLRDREPRHDRHAARWALPAPGA